LNNSQNYDKYIQKKLCRKTSQTVLVKLQSYPLFASHQFINTQNNKKMELLIAILIAMGSLLSPDDFTKEYELQYQSDIEKANYIMDSGSYTTTKDGGVVIDQDIDG
jgi:hypothetical protein